MASHGQRRAWHIWDWLYHVGKGYDELMFWHGVWEQYTKIRYRKQFDLQVWRLCSSWSFGFLSMVVILQGAAMSQQQDLRNGMNHRCADFL